MVGKGITEFKDCHKGIGFVAGSGPSLRFVPRDLSIRYPVICVNGSYSWFYGDPYYFTCDGKVVFKEHWQSLRNGKEKIFCDTSGSQYIIEHWGGIQDTSRIVLFNRHSGNEIKDKSDELIMGTSSAHAAVNLAYIMGFDPVVLLGIDCAYDNGKKYYSDFDGCPKDDYLMNGIYRENVVVNKDSTSDCFTDTFYSTWADIKLKNPSINILNASGGRLDVFPRVKLEDLI